MHTDRERNQKRVNELVDAVDREDVLVVLSKLTTIKDADIDQDNSSLRLSALQTAVSRHSPKLFLIAQLLLLRGANPDFIGPMTSARERAKNVKNVRALDLMSKWDRGIKDEAATGENLLKMDPKEAEAWIYETFDRPKEEPVRYDGARSAPPYYDYRSSPALSFPPPFGPTQLFFTYLPTYCDESVLRDHLLRLFLRIGISHQNYFKIIDRPDGRIAFTDMDNPAQARAVIDSLDGVDLLGSKIKIEFNRTAPSTAALPPPFPRPPPSHYSPPPLRIRVGNLPSSFAEVDVRRLFSRAVGDVQAVSFRAAGAGWDSFVTLWNPSDGERAVAALDGLLVEGSPLWVEYERREPAYDPVRSGGWGERDFRTSERNCPPYDARGRGEWDYYPPPETRYSLSPPRCPFERSTSSRSRDGRSRSPDGRREQSYGRASPERRRSSVTSSTARSPPALRTHPYSSPVDLATSVPVTFNCAHSADGRRRRRL